MSSYWMEHSKQQSIEEMMLDEDASKITQHEHPEVLGLLPDLKGKQVLELGAGIGCVCLEINNSSLQLAITKCQKMKTSTLWIFSH